MANTPFLQTIAFPRYIQYFLFKSNKTLQLSEMRDSETEKKKNENVCVWEKSATIACIEWTWKDVCIVRCQKPIIFFLLLLSIGSRYNVPPRRLTRSFFTWLLTGISSSFNEIRLYRLMIWLVIAENTVVMSCKNTYEFGAYMPECVYSHVLCGYDRPWHTVSWNEWYPSIIWYCSTRKLQDWNSQQPTGQTHSIQCGEDQLKSATLY